MQNLIDDILPGLLAHRLDLPDLQGGAVHPHYAGFSLVNLPSSVCAWLGATPPGTPLDPALTAPLKTNYQHVIVLVLDGLGLDLFRRYTAPGGPAAAAWTSMFGESNGALGCITSVTPSTTTAAITSLWTGVPPIQHGMLGYELWLKELGVLTNMITFTSANLGGGDAAALRKAGFDPASFLPVPTLAQRLAVQGVRVVALQPGNITGSGLSLLALNGVEMLPYRSRGDLFLNLIHQLQRLKDERAYIYMYWPEVDELSHRFGPDDERVAIEFASFTAMLNEFLPRIKAAAEGAPTLLAITADHGQTVMPPDPRFAINAMPDIMDCLIMQPVSERRIPYLYVKPGREDDLAHAVERRWGGGIQLIDSRQAVQAGLFGGGQPYARALERVADRVALTGEGHYWFWGRKENLTLGGHGGLSRAEMLTPLILMEL